MDAAKIAGKPTLIGVVGPTASGKSELAIQLAERHHGEIVSADSVQIYRHFDIGSGKPLQTDLARAPHHLIGEVDPLEEMDASLFAERALSLIDEIRQRGRVPIICGGTFLWVRALIYGLAPAPPKNEAIRQRHRALVEQAGRGALHEMLRSVDLKSFERLEPNDFVRVSRALEVHELTGKPLSAFQQEHGFRSPRFSARLIGLQFSNDALTDRIRARAEQMIERGWIDEVKSLEKRGYRSARAMASVGYRQVLEYVDEGKHDEAQLVEDVTRVTRIFARRQRTWLRGQPIEWLAPPGSEEFELPAP